MKRPGTVAQKLGQGAAFMPSLNLRFERKFLLLRPGASVLPQPSLYVLFRCDLRKIRSCLIGRLCLPDVLVRFAGIKREQPAYRKPASDSREREKIASAWQQRLHRVIIDM